MTAQSPPLPEDFAVTLRTMRAAKDRRLGVTLRAARDAGWTTVVLAAALDCTPQNVRQLSVRPPSHPDFRLPAIPALPPKPPPPPRTPKTDRRARKQHKLTPAQIAELQALNGIARTVRSGTPADSPKRRASEQLAALLAEYRAAGVTVSELAREMGVLRGSIQGRLSRHGYREAPPSMTAKLYKGRNRWETVQ